MPIWKLRWPALLAVLLAFTAPSALWAAEAPKKPWDVNQPPGPRSTVNLDTRSGTWMSVDVSPDGKTDRLRPARRPLYPADRRRRGQAADPLHRLGHAGALLAGRPADRLPLSDAGGGDNIWVMNADGSGARAVTQGRLPAAEQPGLAAQRQIHCRAQALHRHAFAGSGEIWLFHVDGDAAKNKGVQLNEKPNWQKDLGEPAVSPDGRYLYYSQDTTPGRVFEYNKDAHEGIFKIFRQDLNDGSTEPFVQGPGGAVRPTPSPDGKYLAFVRRVRNQSTLFLKDLADRREFAVWDRLARPAGIWSVHGVYPAFAWMPDASRNGRLGRRAGSGASTPSRAIRRRDPFHVKDTREVRERCACPGGRARAVRRQAAALGEGVAGRRARRLFGAGLSVFEGLAAGTPRRLTSRASHFEFFPELFARRPRASSTRPGATTPWAACASLDLAERPRDRSSARRRASTWSRAFSPDGRWVVYARCGRLPDLALAWPRYRPLLAAADGKGRPSASPRTATAPQFGSRSDELFVTRKEQHQRGRPVRKLMRIDLADRSETEVARSDSSVNTRLAGRPVAGLRRALPCLCDAAAARRQAEDHHRRPKMDALPVRQLDLNAGRIPALERRQQADCISRRRRAVHTELKNAFAFVAGAPKDKPADGLKIGFRRPATSPRARSR
jgi:hypothetical protein